MNTFITALLHQPYVVPSLLAIVGVVVLTLAYIIIFNLLNIHKKHYIATITFPDIHEQDTLAYIEKMRVVFDALYKTILSQTKSVFIEILRSEGYIHIQLGSSNKQVLDLAKRAFSQVENMVISDAETDALNSFTKLRAKSVYTSKPFYPINKNVYFFDSIINFLSQLPDEESAGVQFILRGVKKKLAMDWEIGGIERRKRSEKRISYTSEEEEKIMLYKIKRKENLFKTKVYVFASEKQSLLSLVSLFSALNNEGSDLYSYRGLVSNIRRRFIAPDTMLAWWIPMWRELEGNYFTSSELASMFHPTSLMSGRYTAKKTRDIDASPEFLTESDSNIVIGTVENKQGKTKNIYLPLENMHHHVYLLGKTGRGKSSFLTALASDIINKQRGNSFIFDPHGDFLQDVISTAKQKENLVYLNIKDQKYSFTINPLFCFRMTESEKAVIKDKILTIIKQETEEQTGNFQMGVTTQNRIEEILDVAIEFPDAYYNYLLANEKSPEDAEKLVQERQLTFNDLPYIFDKDLLYIAMLQKIFKDVETTTGMYVMKDLEKHANNQMVVDAVQARCKQLLHFALKYVFEGNKLSVKEAIQSNKAFLIPIPDAEYGDHGARGLMQMLYSFLWITKKEVKKENRQDTFVFIDECQKVQINTIEENLSEGRKYKNYLVLANQHTGQLKPAIKNSILGNVGTLVSFTLSAGEIGAETIAKEFGDTLTEKDLTLLPAHKAYMITERHTQKDTVPLSFSTIPVEQEEKDSSIVEDINLASLQQYGEEKEILKKRIYRKRTNAKAYFTEDL